MINKKRGVGIKLPNGQTKTLLYIIPSKDGYILTVPHSDTHVTILDKGIVISSHVTHQLTDEHDHLGELSKSDDFNNVIDRALRLHKLEENEYDRPLFYLTKKGMNLVNERQLVWIEEESKDQIATYIDIPSMISRARDTAIELSKAPESFFGRCRARDLLSNSEVEVGFPGTQDNIGIVDIDGELYEIDLTSFLDMKTKSPLHDIFKPLGIPIISNELEKRLKDIIDRAFLRGK